MSISAPTAVRDHPVRVADAAPTRLAVAVPEGRYRNIDVLRGVAALLVVWLHSAEALVRIPAIRALGSTAYDVASFLNSGRAGVIAFFAISGFVIPATIRGEPRSGTSRFAIKRVLRLYPAYWAALVLSYLAIWLPEGRHPTVPDVLANLSMIPTPFGVANAMAHFWTLEVEFLFYLLVVVLFVTGRLKQPVLLAALACILSLKGVGRIAGYAEWEQWQGHWGFTPLCLAIMLWGALLRASYDPDAGALSKLRAWCTLPVLITTAFILARTLNFGAIFKGEGLHSYLSGLGAFWGLLLFVVFALLGQRWPRWLVWPGTVSYSIYLFHPVVFYPLYYFLLARPQVASLPLGVWILVVAAGTVLLASLTYLTIEAPANRWATRLARRVPDAGRAA